MARRKARVTGADEIRKNALKLKAKTRRDIRKGLIAGGLLVKKDSQQLVPVRVGNLRASAYLVSTSGEGDESGDFNGEQYGELVSRHGKIVMDSFGAVKVMTKKGQSVIAIGYTAPYALSVHENPRAGVAGWRSASQQFKSSTIASGPKKGGKRTAADFHSMVGAYKFLEVPLRVADQHILPAIAAAAKLPPGPVRS